MGWSEPARTRALALSPSLMCVFFFLRSHFLDCASSVLASGMGMNERPGAILQAAAVFLLVLVMAGFLADEARERPRPAARLQTELGHIDSRLSQAQKRRAHWYASGEGPDDGHKPITWADIIHSNYPAEPQFGPTQAQLYKQDPSLFERRRRAARTSRPGLGTMLHTTSPDAPTRLDRMRDRWAMAGEQRELHGRMPAPSLAQYVQAGWPTAQAPLSAAQRQLTADSMKYEDGDII